MIYYYIMWDTFRITYIYNEIRIPRNNGNNEKP